MWRIKGWYDAQFLAIPGPNGLVPSRIRGVIIPNPDLPGIPKSGNAACDGAEPPKPYCNRWVAVGIVRVDSAYKAFQRGVNRIEFCNGSADNCRIPAAIRAQATSAWGQPPNECKELPNPWWGQLIHPDSTREYACVRRKSHEADLMGSGGVAGKLPATARWIWYAEDEGGGWFGCEASSCCRP